MDAAEGLLYHNSDNGEKRFVQCAVGDTLKVSIVPLSHQRVVTVEFYHNGRLVTTETMDVPEGGLYGVIGLASPREAVVVNPPQREEVEPFEKLYETKSTYITHLGDGTCTYVSPRSPSFYSHSDESPPLYVGTLRSVRPIEADETFEVRLLDRGAEGAIAVGICPPDYPIDSMPGWIEGSIGYHADMNSVLSGMENKYDVAEWKEGDVLSVSVDAVDGSTKELRVVFRKNSDIIWKDKMWNPSSGLHWCLGLMSNKERVRVLLPRRVISLNMQLSKFEDVWQLTSPSVEYIREGICLYVGHHDGPGIIRSRKPINPLSQHPFFEMKIINFGRAGGIIIGVCSGDYSLVEMPGLKPKSIGFCCYSGYLYQNSELPQVMGVVCSQGDVIRCTVSPVDKSDKRVAVTFQHNGEVIAKVMDWSPSHGFHAQLGMISEYEAIQIAYPLMQPSILKKGLDGIDPDITRPVKSLKPRTAQLPLLSSERIPIDHVDSPGDYSYVKPVSPLLHGRMARSAHTSPFAIQDDGKRRGSYPADKPKEGFKKFHQNSEPALPVGEPSAQVVLPMEESLVSTSSLHSQTSLTSLSLPSTPSSQPTTPSRTRMPLLSSTPLGPSTPLLLPVITEQEPVTPEEEVVKILELPKAANRLFKCLHDASYATDTDILSVSSTFCKGSYAYAVRRQTLTEKMNYFEVDVLHGAAQGVSVGVSSGTLLSNMMLGTYPNTLSYELSSGKLFTGSPEHHTESNVTFKDGDTIGCLVSVLSTPSCRPNDEKNLFYPPEVRVEFYKNATPILQATMSLPPNSLCPSICFSLPQSSVKLVWKYKMKPCDYFECHPVPEGYRNFSQPLTPPTPSGWQVYRSQKCELVLEGDVTKLSLSSDLTGRDKQLLLQHYLPFSLSDMYFEIELAAPSTTYSIVSLGAAPRVMDSPLLPGERGGTIGFFPLTGIIMRNGDVVSYNEDEVVHLVSSSRGSLRIGLGMEIDEATFSKNRSVFLFFTINSQEVSKLICTVPPDGLFPTLSIQSKSSKVPLIDRTLCRLFFPQPWPCNNVYNAPLAVARMSGFTEHSSSFIYYRDDIDVQGVKGVQACYAISPKRPFFEVSVLQSNEFKISVGLAPLLHPLDTHVGLSPHSIGYIIDKCGFFYVGLKVSETPFYTFQGVKIGCGVLFPEDGSMGSAEVFFLINGILALRKFIEIPTSGLFPSVGISSESLVTLTFDLPLPFSHMRFSSQWLVLENVEATGYYVQSKSHAHMGIAQLAQSPAPDRMIYFKCSFRTSPFDSGKVLIGFSNGKDSPFLSKVSATNCSYFMELSSGTIIIIQMGQRQSAECLVPKGSAYVGCGISPIENSHSFLLFFTADNTVIYAHTINLSHHSQSLHPMLCMVGAMGKIGIQTCPLWPPFSSVGSGWGRFCNIQYTQGSLVGSNNSKSNSRNECGFIQSSTPLIPSNSYFEVEVLKRDPKKAIAVGLASRQYSQTQWVGWKPESIGYHFDDGKLFKANTMGMTFGPKLFEGDTLGCGIEFNDNSSDLPAGSRVEVFFTVNGHRLTKTEMMTVPSGGLYPTICLESVSERVCAYLRPKRSLGLSRLSTLWSRGYCMSQAGNILQHSFQVKSQKFVNSFPEGFCQGSEPLSQTHCYFEVEVLSFGEKSNFSIGIAPLQPEGSRKLVTSSVTFTASGQVITYDGGRPMTTPTRQKVEVGDRIGCRFKSFGERHMSVEFCRNGIKVVFAAVPASISNQPLYPTIVFTTPEDSVVPLLCSLPPPGSLPAHQIGWLRSERVKMKGCIVEYTGPGVENQRSVGVAQTNQPLTLRCPYYEIEILSMGQSCMIAIGAAALDHPLFRQPGWVTGSIGHHGDDGRLFSESGTGYAFGSPWKQNDIVGLGVRPVGGNDILPGTEVQVFITYNGREIGHVTFEVPPSGLFPTIGFHSKGEKVKIHHNAKQSNFATKSLLKWRMLIGMKHRYSIKKREEILTYFKNSRTKKHGYAFSLAIGSEPFSDRMTYFEVKLLNLGKVRAIAIGATAKAYSPDHVPGWVDGSIAYHTDSGYLHHASGNGRVFGPIANRGDTIGCGMSILGSHCTVFFTRNGTEIGHRIQASVPKGGFYPAIGFVSPGDQVSVSFMDTFKPSSRYSECLVGIMRIQNASYSDNLLTFNSGVSSSAANAQFGVSLNTSRNYYRVNIIKLEDNVKIGLAPRDYPLTHAPGMSSYSVAYDVTDGIVKGVFGHTVKIRQVLKCTKGDTVGCGLRVSDESEGNNQKKISTYHAFFTLNGVIVHEMELPNLHDDLFPVVGCIPNRKLSAVYMDWTLAMFDTLNAL